MSKPKSKKQQRPNQQQYKSKQSQRKASNKPLIFLTLAFVAVIAVIIIGMNQQNKPVSFDYASLPMQGSADAPVKIVEFGDYKCPACQDFAQNVKPQLEQEYINSGKVAFHFINYTFIAEDSYTAALAAESVRQQNEEAFWTYYKLLYDNQKAETIKWATPDYLVQLAKDAKLPIDYDLLRSDIDNKTYKDRIEKDNSLVRPMNVTGTPTLFVNGKKLNSYSYNSVKAAIDNELKG
ncbi:thioredoxin domain-containing protein [Paenibacillus sp. NEAU-GSW1]|uniref:DsbA family protein n=1 Tax=Paenibacillus sp. NEAU-GSW1 TaxID=2682486 RepID=UPI0020A690DC|nr:thioredoxin domain-containing protein [Paenibacillus sp. NEAU-GSW1]